MAVFPQKNGTARPIQLLSNRRFALVVDHHCADYEEDDGEERGEGDHDAFVESVCAASGRAVFGAKV
jgi:hypothetical protein